MWEEYHRQYPAQAIALARLVSLRSMREHRLILREDGRVVERPAEGKPRRTPKPAVTFPLTVGGEEVRVEYVEQYFPNSGAGMLYFRSPHEPARPHPLSEKRPPTNSRSRRGAERASRAALRSAKQTDRKAGSCDNGMAGSLAGRRLVNYPHRVQGVGTCPPARSIHAASPRQELYAQE